ncbi:MAG TPA: TlpA disulfide reductase family protein [Phycisphaerales bacterium]|nr:TlpA disulfide reductase family protein [Phycisphaerales bacterium]HMP37753.1 TlpA disulfide reductase family protein [Phycisphaerales bacterium]
MISRLSSILVGVIASLLVTAAATAQQPRLDVGKAAPGLDVRKWFNGPPVKIESGKVYIIEFWATWCGPCKQSIPHLNSLAKRFASKGLVVIGISDEPAETVDRFVQEWGDRMSYHVAADRDKATSRAWMEAAGQKVIPAAFIVDRNGRVVHIGNPLDPDFEMIVRLAVANRWDPKKYAAALPAIEAAERAARIRNWSEAYGHLDRVIATDPSLFVFIAQRRLEIVLAEEQNAAAAQAYVKALADLYATDPTAMIVIAEDLVSNPKYTDAKRLYPQALALAQAIKNVAAEGQPEVFATLALVQFHMGDLDAAIENQMQAWMLAVPEDKLEYRRTLDRYRNVAERAAARSN